MPFILDKNTNSLKNIDTFESMWTQLRENTYIRANGKGYRKLLLLYKTEKNKLLDEIKDLKKVITK